jgi:hypothetical protein
MGRLHPGQSPIREEISLSLITADMGAAGPCS